jgi:cytochrome d ubiquinol oxidase subunit II
MDPLVMAVSVVLLVALTIYTLTGGADFGGGVWDLLARGPRAQEERKLIARAIGPIWETNHVWLILVIVLLFVCFPRAFSVLMTALHVPMTLMLFGVLLRGSAFIFRSYGGGDAQEGQRWGRVFSVSSALTPVLLGVCLGAASSGRIVLPEGLGAAQRAAPHITDFWMPWLAPFPWAVGVFNLCLCTFLAAVYLIHEAPEGWLREAFRRRALITGVVTGAVALVAYLLAADGAPLVYAGLTAQPWSVPLHLATAAAALTTLWALWRARDGLARVAAITQASLIIAGWSLSLFPYLVPPSLTLSNAAASPDVLRPVLYTLGAGSLLLIPALVTLLRVFKRSQRPI